MKQLTESYLLVDYVTYAPLFDIPPRLTPLSVAQLARQIFVYKDYAKMREMRSELNKVKVKLS